MANIYNGYRTVENAYNDLKSKKEELDAYGKKVQTVQNITTANR